MATEVVEVATESEHDEIHRGLKSQTPADVRLLNRRTSAGELCRSKKLLTSQLRVGDKFFNQFDSYPSTRVRCYTEIFVQSVNNKLAALNSFRETAIDFLCTMSVFSNNEQEKCIF